MQIGRFLVEQLSEGFFEFFNDGTFQKIDPNQRVNPDGELKIGEYSSASGIDPLLISGHGKNIVIDPGLGWGLDYNSRYINTSNVITNLEIFDITPAKIDFVILTHLHFDHAAGSTFVTDDLKTTATFPNAIYLVHKKEWEYALSQTVHQSEKNRFGAGYNLDELYKLAAEERFFFIENEHHVPVNGVELFLTGGHTPGHMVVKISDQNNTAWFPGDLVPTEHHLNHYSMKIADTDPLQAKKIKKKILEKSLNEDAILFFYHSLYRKSGKLIQDKQKQIVLVDI